MFFVFLVPARDPRVEVPTVKIKPRCRSDQVGDVLLRLLLQVHETDHHVGHLHAGVVDIVLNIDRMPSRPQQANESVAENGISQMPDVGRLVGIDAGVLDQDLAADVGCALARVAVDAAGVSPFARSRAASSRFRRALM